MIDLQAARQSFEEHRILTNTGGWGTWSAALMAGFSFNPIVLLDRKSVKPTEAELRMPGSYQDFAVDKIHLDKRYLVVLEQPFMAVMGINPLILLKGKEWSSNGEDGWCYRRMT